jgi:glycosyltransferase involved in cell wall biosynthesis
MPSRPFLSILLPSRNRLELLKLALRSIVTEGKTHIEVIVSDNASTEDYAGYIEGLRFPVRYLRQEQPLSATENWNRALDAAAGRYVLMLGDDDALAPGFVQRVMSTADAFDQPEVIYMMAYHYAYPGVFASNPGGFFYSVQNSVLFQETGAPYELIPERAIDLARQALRFRHLISFNAQHFVWRRDFIRRIARSEAFFRPPYPDYFACFMTFLNAKRMVVMPSPQVIIGIAKQSFGFFLANNREDEGQEGFLNPTPDEMALADGASAIIEALSFPGSQHYRNWLIAALLTRRAMQSEMDLDIDLRRYRRVQLQQLAQRAAMARGRGRAEYWRTLWLLDERERDFARDLMRQWMTLGRVRTVPREPAFIGLSELLNIYHPTRITTHEIGQHSNILHAVKWLGEQEQSPQEPAPKKLGGAENPAGSSST